MKDHYSLSDNQFEQQFADRTLDPKLFSHEAHIRLAWIHVKKYGVALAASNICEQIKSFDATFGDGTKYNKTVTVAAVKAVNHFVDRSSSTDFKGFIKEFPELVTDFKYLLDQHYGFDIFNNEVAKSEYLEPDLQPF